jgi:hypothetical protein
MEEQKIRRPLLVLDFDGVVHAYTTPWESPTVIADGPVPGAFAFIEQALTVFDVAIYSSRSATREGIKAMMFWFVDHGCDLDVVQRLKFPQEKPSAFVTLDDRAITFTGQWPRIADIQNFRPWNKQ